MCSYHSVNCVHTAAAKTSCPEHDSKASGFFRRLVDFRWGAHDAATDIGAGLDQEMCNIGA